RAPNRARRGRRRARPLPFPPPPLLSPGPPPPPPSPALPAPPAPPAPPALPDPPDLPDPPVLPGLYHADVRHRVALLERRHGTNEHDDALFRRRHVVQRTIEIVGDDAELRALRDVRVAIDGRLEHAVALRGERPDLLDPDP